MTTFTTGATGSNQCVHKAGGSGSNFEFCQVTYYKVAPGLQDCSACPKPSNAQINPGRYKESNSGGVLGGYLGTTKLVPRPSRGAKKLFSKNEVLTRKHS